MVIVDSNIIFEFGIPTLCGALVGPQLRSLSTSHDLAINPVIYCGGLV